MSPFSFWAIFFAFLGLLQFGACATLVIFGDSMSDKTEVQLAVGEKILQSPQYHSDKNNFVYAHGFNESISSESTKTVMTTAIQLGKFNPILLNWQEEAAAFTPTNSLLDPLVVTPSSYAFKAVPEVFAVGTECGYVFARMRDLGFNISNTYFIGFSLGAQLMGQCARTYKNATGGESFNKIHGLEPAGPLFTSVLPILPPVTKGVAKNVTCWHTDTSYGTNQTLCDIDARFNWLPFAQSDKEKQFQPGCTDVLCNHIRVLKYFVEAITSCGSMVGALATSVYDWIRQPNCTDLVYMCLDVVPTVPTGVYYLNTTDSPPYGLGLAGACPPKT